MNKAELVSKLSEKVRLPKKQVEELVNTLTDTIIHTLKKGDEVVIAGFGSFSAKRREERMGINPRPPYAKIKIPSVVVAKFKAGSELKKALKGGKK